MSPTAPPSRAGELGQATIELVALLPLMAVLGALLWQAVVAGQAIWFVGSAARAAARASAVGADPRLAARRVLPEHLERGLEVRRARGEEGVRVVIAIPTVIGTARLGSVSAHARLQDQTR
jgi:type IV secretory pathway TrbD component